MTGVWTTREGAEIPITDLSDGHLLNIIRLFGRKYQTRAALWAFRALEYAFSAPDGASMAAEEYANSILNGDEVVWAETVKNEDPVLKELLEEAKERGILYV